MKDRVSLEKRQKVLSGVESLDGLPVEIAHGWLIR